MKPSIGRIVHYRSYGTPGGEYPSECRAAIITMVHNSNVVDLCAINPNGLFFNKRVKLGEEPGRWHWPERVEE